ncbi:hypothetical protein DFH06DRAFT_1123889 [Mycena polygramma]|nr:hypothetical protein DFH06DRAFT_1123889 [Mycena polygramma]
MTRIHSGSTTPPPLYNNEEDADLQCMLGALTITPPASPTCDSPRPTALYVFTARITPSWSEAAALTQGVAGSPRRLTPKPRSNKKPAGGHVVFFGRKPGAYRTWYGEAEPLVKGVSGSIHQVYHNFNLAGAAYDYAREQGWTRVLPVPCYDVSTAGPPILHFPIPDAVLDTPNPLHAGSSARDGHWYVVYSGILPGVYQSSLECSLNTVGISCVTFESFDSKVDALTAFQDAVADSRVRVITPKYVISLYVLTPVPVNLKKDPQDKKQAQPPLPVLCPR